MGATTYKVLEYQIRFMTPAFLGNAEQVGQWRTPPFKALLRQWWRVAYAAGRHDSVDVDAMRHEEGQLFGVAADERGESRKSQIRIRLERWDLGKQRDWINLDSKKVIHPEVGKGGHGMPIGPHLYLGYGPLVFRQGQTALKANAAIQGGEEARLSVALPTQYEATFGAVLQLIDLYGAVGGRSRNGWGSFAISAIDERTPSPQRELKSAFTRPWQHALDLDWPHAIGSDRSGPLIWQTENTDDWPALMRRMAEIKIALRRQFKFDPRKANSIPQDRHWLSYPVTHHNVSAWKEDGKRELRLPNTLRFKIRPDANGKLRGVIFHVPCLPLPQFRPDPEAIRSVWKRVHAFLDDPAQKLSRIPA